MAANRQAAASCRTDKSTQASLEDFSFKHLALALTCDFEAKTLSGTATWTVEVKRGASWLVLDTSSGLTVSEVSVCGAAVEHVMRPAHDAFGVACAIPIPEALQEVGRELKVKMAYSTAPGSSALQWLPPEQTAGKERPYMFSQCQAIHARALLPCADAPTAKFTYEATVVARMGDGTMSAVSSGAPTDKGGGKREFASSTVPVPSYLVATAVGDLRGVRSALAPPSGQSRRSSRRRLRVSARRSRACRTSGSATTSCACRPRFRARVATPPSPSLPPSLSLSLSPPPHAPPASAGLSLPPRPPPQLRRDGEPLLTFATPTLLAGDRPRQRHRPRDRPSDRQPRHQPHVGALLAQRGLDALAREPHPRALRGRRRRGALQLLDAGEPHPPGGRHRAVWRRQSAHGLCPPLDGIDPDDAFSAVPFQKGLALLNLLTKVVGGRPQFEDFSRRTLALPGEDARLERLPRFLPLVRRAAGLDASEVDWEAWFLTPMPHRRALPGHAGRRVHGGGGALARREVRGRPKVASASEYAGWPSQLKIHFLDVLLSRSLAAPAPPMSSAVIAKMDSLYELTRSKNSSCACAARLYPPPAGLHRAGGAELPQGGGAHEVCAPALPRPSRGKSSASWRWRPAKLRGTTTRSPPNARADPVSS